MSEELLRQEGPWRVWRTSRVWPILLLMCAEITWVPPTQPIPYNDHIISLKNLLNLAIGIYGWTVQVYQFLDILSIHSEKKMLLQAPFQRKTNHLHRTPNQTLSPLSLSKCYTRESCSTWESGETHRGKQKKDMYQWSFRQIPSANQNVVQWLPGTKQM